MLAARRRSRTRISRRTKRKRCKGKRKSCKSGASATHDSKSPEMRLQVRERRQTGAFNDAKKCQRNRLAKPKKPQNGEERKKEWSKESKPKPKLKLC